MCALQAESGIAWYAMVVSYWLDIVQFCKLRYLILVSSSTAMLHVVDLSLRTMDCRSFLETTPIRNYHQQLVQLVSTVVPSVGQTLILITTK